MFWIQRRQGVAYPPSFRPPGGRPRNPIKGGRWQIRKKIDGKWAAFTTGKAMKWSRKFDTHAEAIRWARLVAVMYANCPPGREELRDEILRNIKRNGYLNR